MLCCLAGRVTAREYVSPATSYVRDFGDQLRSALPLDGPHRPRSDLKIPRRGLFISPEVVEKHVASSFDKLGLAPSESDNRRVIAAVRYPESLPGS